MNLIRLTDWEDGLEVYVNPSEIRSMRRLSAEVFEPIMAGDVYTELGERTRIDTKTDVLLVKETPNEILALAAAEETP